MRVKLILVIALTISTTGLNAQFALGIEGGANFSTAKISGLPGFDIGYQANYFAGLSPRYAIDDRFTLIADIAYSVTGHKISSEATENTGLFRNTYVIITPQFEFKSNEFFKFNDGLSLLSSAGLFTGIKLKEELKVSNTDWYDPSDFGENYLKAIDFGLTLAVRLYFNSFYLKAMYDIGFINVDDGNIVDSSGRTLDIKQRSRNIQLGVGYVFDFSDQ